MKDLNWLVRDLQGRLLTIHDIANARLKSSDRLDPNVSHDFHEIERISATRDTDKSELGPPESNGRG